MASRPRRYTAEEVLQRLQEIDSDESIIQSEKSDESIDDEPATLLTQHNLEALPNDSSCESSGDEPAAPTPLTLTASSGAVWTDITGQLGAGRVPLGNIFRALAGPTAYGNVRAVYNCIQL